MMVGQKLEERKTELSLSETESFANDNMISFEDIYQNYCVGIVDIVNSTKIISTLSQEKACIYYSVFLNTLGYIAQSHGAKVVKNIGDGILFYFPRDSDGPESALKCASKMVDASKMMDTIFEKRKMPKIQYRISLDYGPLMIANYMASSCKDIFGPTVNMCAKLNHMAKPNGIVIGGDLYQMVRRSNQFHFSQIGGYASVLKQEYPVYCVKI